MKQPIRYFSIGILAASLIVLIVVSFFDNSDDHIGEVSEDSVKEMITTLQDQGYHVLTSPEYITLSVATDSDKNKGQVEREDKENDPVKKENKEKATKEQEKTQKNKKVDKEEKPTKKVHKYQLTIEPNMLSPTISKLLKDNNIIDDADEFSRYLENEGYAPYLQLGEHDVSSDMSNYEIAETIAKTR